MTQSQSDRNATFLSPDACVRAAAHASDASGHAVRSTGFYAYTPSLAAGRFQLANGLTIILMPMQRTPVFAYQTWFRVGSKHEDPNRTGLAHLFEHLMFKGTHRHPVGQLDREMERRGSQTNAATWVDWTYYTESLAARDDNLEVIVDFESDRMTGLILDDATFRSELDVVKNERRMSVDDSITGAMNEQLCALAYTKHPYRWPTIGSMAHLEAATLADLEQFYRSYYAPNNATIVITGAVDLTATLTLLATRYGAIPSHATPPPPAVVEPPQTAGRQVVMQRPIVSPQMLIAFPAPAQSHPDYAALEILCDTLGSGDTARLYHRLVTELEWAVDASVFLSPFAEPGLCEIAITLREDIAPADVTAVVHEELARLIREGITDDELLKAKHSLEVGQLESLRDVEGCAEALGHHETNYGDFTLAFKNVERMAAVTHADLKRVGASVFCVNRCNQVIALPSGEAVDSDADHNDDDDEDTEH